MLHFDNFVQPKIRVISSWEILNLIEYNYFLQIDFWVEIFETSKMSFLNGSEIRPCAVRALEIHAPTLEIRTA
jgi:hypothetical protein